MAMMAFVATASLESTAAIFALWVFVRLDDSIRAIPHNSARSQMYFVYLKKK